MKKQYKENYLPIFVLVCASIFFLYDIITDITKGEDNFLHLFTESCIFISISIILFIEIKRAYKLYMQVLLEKEKVSALSGELYRIITSQFEDWSLSASEKEVALLIIKGFSMKEISELRSVKEKTIRQQATSIYNKTGLSGRHELAAYFIEDLLNVKKE